MNNKNQKQPIKHHYFDEYSMNLPQALDLEEAILGAIILESESDQVKSVIIRLRACYFFKKSHQLIFNAIKDLYNKKLPVDLLTVTEQCRKNQCLKEIGGGYAITMLIARVCSSVHIDYWFKIIYEKFLQREIIRIGREKVNQVFQESKDCFDLLDEFIAELEKLDPIIFKSVSKTADDVAEKMLKEIQDVKIHGNSKGNNPGMIYCTGWDRFDKVVSLGKDKIILIAGAAKAGKSRLIRAIIYKLLEHYGDVSVCWITLEDSREDLYRSYLASKVFVTAKNIRLRNYSKEKLPQMELHSKRFRKFDIEFIDETIKSDEVVSRFVRFCDKRKDRFNILVVDNILSLDDQMDFKFDPNGFCNYVMQNLLKCRQKTGGLIFALHHFNDAQQNKENLKTGYRPVLKDMKGSETFRRTPNQVLLINSFNIYKDLISEYSNERKRLMNYLFIIDASANREDKISDDVALIHFFTEMAYDQFWEIPLPDSNQLTNV